MSFPSLSSSRLQDAALKCGTLLAAVAVIFGCGGAQSTGSSSSSEAYTGPVTVTNQTDTPICGADFFQWNPEVRISSNRFTDSPIAQGESREFDRGGAPTERLRLVGCDGRTVLWDSFEPRNGGMWDSTDFAGGGNVTLVASGAPVLAGSSLTLVRENIPMSNYVPVAGGLASQWPNIFQIVTAIDQQINFNGEALSATIVSNEWDIETDSYGNPVHRDISVWVGFQRPGDYCFYNIWRLREQHVGGGSYSGNLTRPPQQGAFHQVACEVLGVGGGASAAPAATPAAPAAAPSGGNCTNTCRTSNDGECDDGGPNSLYSICGLGTDCNDCGPR